MRILGNEVKANSGGIVSTLVLMRFLESSPRRYDLGMLVITCGATRRAQQWLAQFVPRGGRLLEIGCGTGSFTALAAQRAGYIKAIDVNGAMLERARERLRPFRNVVLEERGVADLDREPEGHYDAIAALFTFSELSESELRWTLQQSRRLLVPEGRLLVADERMPTGVAAILSRALRLLLQPATWLLAGRVSRPLSGFERQLAEYGLELRVFKPFLGGTIGAWVARKQ